MTRYQIKASKTLYSKIHISPHLTLVANKTLPYPTLPSPYIKWVWSFSVRILKVSCLLQRYIFFQHNMWIIFQWPPLLSAGADCMGSSQGLVSNRPAHVSIIMGGQHCTWARKAEGLWDHVTGKGRPRDKLESTPGFYCDKSLNTTLLS